MIRTLPKQWSRVLQGMIGYGVLFTAVMVPAQSSGQDADEVLEIAVEMLQQPEAFVIDDNAFDKLIDGVFQEDQANGPSPRPEAVEVRNERITAWWTNREAHLAEVLQLTDVQKEKRNAVFHTRLATDQRRFGRRAAQAVLSDSSPIVFTRRTGAADRLRRGVRRSLLASLTDEQKATLEQHMTDRRNRIAKRFAHRAVAVIDRELLLSENQRQQCLNVMANMASRRGEGLYKIGKANGYLPYLPVSGFEKQLTDAPLTTAQKLRLRLLAQETSSPPRGQFIVNDDGDPNSASWVQVSYRARKRTFNSMSTVLQDAISQEDQLTPAQIRQLTLALKGIASRTLRAYRRTLEDAERSKQDVPEQGIQFVRVGQAGGDAQFVVIPPNQRAASFGLITNHPLWHQAIAQVTVSGGDNVFARRLRFRNESAHWFILGTLDLELYLSAAQAENLLPLIKATQPELVIGLESNMPEMAMLARALRDIPDNAVAELLTTEQMICWKALRAQFQFVAEDNATIATSHGPLNLMLSPHDHGPHDHDH